MKDHYRTLGVPENASEADIKLAYRRLAKRYHPDVNAGARGAEERFKEIVEAYSVLSDPILRRAYDNRRMRKETFASAFHYTTPAKEKPKDPKRKAYSPDDLARAQQRHRNRATAQMGRRKKLLVGMVVTFIIYLTAAAAFESYLEEQRVREAEELAKKHAQLTQAENQKRATTIKNFDSPYDSLFGSEQDVWNSPNNIVFINPLSDAVICAVQETPAHKVVRNEFVRAGDGFVMRRLPKGSYSIRVYTGAQWDVKKRVTGGKPLGGFTKDEEFFRLRMDPIVLDMEPVAYPVKDEIRDTVVIDPTIIPFEHISREEFFATEK